jgi:hypothetical protein
MPITWRRLPWIGLALLAVALVVLWAARLRIASSIVHDKLAAAGVPAGYRVTRIGPFLERLEDVRIGDPGRPDLIARRIDVRIGYSLSGPEVRGVRVDGVRLRATLARDGLHLGVLDRLMPASTGGPIKLPDLDLTVRDTILTLVTPNGAIAAGLAGSGNPMRRFEGQARVVAPALRLASCALRGTDARLAVLVREGEPELRGPIAIGATACGTLQLRQGTATVAASSDATFERVAVNARLAGFGGVAGPTRFMAVDGTVGASGTLGHLAVQARPGFDRFAVPDIARRLAAAGQVPASVPVAPVVRRASGAMAGLLGGARADVSLDATISGERVAVRIHRASLAGSDGARATLVERGALTWGASGWRGDGDLALSGGGLPNAMLQLRQSDGGAWLSGKGAVAPYRVADARLAIPAIRLGWDGRALRFEARALIDGPLGDGVVRGLDVPVNGIATRSGLLTINAGCSTIGFAALGQGGFTVDGTRFTLCGNPIIARAAGGPIRLDASTGPIRLTGRTASGARVTLAASRLHLTNQALGAEALSMTLGESHLQLARLNGEFAGGKIGGTYAQAASAVGHVPLLFSDGSGDWSFHKGSLTLTGKLRVADAAPQPHFLPLVTGDMRLILRDNSIDAAATLREPRSQAEITLVTLTHRLTDGTGHATLAVPGITFAPKKLQPEALTPLTLGVVANVAGTVSGNGRIDWSGAGVRSSGSFGTDRLDLAAAFGPVAGIRTQVQFTDLLGLVTAPHQEATIAEINPGVAVADGVAHFQLVPGQRVAIEDASWPFAGGTLRLEPSTLDFAAEAERRLTFRVDGLDAAAFVQQLDFPNVAATGRFDGALPMIFDKQGGRIEGGHLTARAGGGTLAYVGQLSQESLGTMGKLAFDALKAIRYSTLTIGFDGKLDGEMVSQVNFTGVREATPDPGLVARIIRNLPFRFNIRIQAPFRGLVGTARAYQDPRILLNQATPAEPAIQPAASAPVR